MKNIPNSLSLILAITLAATCTYATNQHSESEKFFSQFEHDQSAWKEWETPYHQDRQPLRQPLIQNSLTIKNILETDYQISIPFNAQYASRYENLFQDVKDKNYTFDRQNGCSAATVRILGSTVSATITSVFPEIPYPKQTRINEVRNSSKQYNEIALHALSSYCVGANSNIEPTLRTFLSELETNLKKSGTKILASREREKKAKAEQEAIRQVIAKQQAEAELHKARIAEEEKRKEIEMAAKAQREENIAKEKAAQERYRAGRAREIQAATLYRNKIKSGELPIKSISDASIYYDAQQDIRVILQPPLEPDHKNHQVRGRLELAQGGTYTLSFSTNNDIKYFIANITPNTIKLKNFTPRAEGSITLVGKFIGLTTYTTLSGRERYAPIFDALVISN